MFEDIDWGTYFPVTINKLGKDMCLTIILSTDTAKAARIDILGAFLDREKPFDELTNIEVITKNKNTLMVKGKLTKTMAETMGDILPVLNEVENIAEVIVNDENSMEDS